MSTTIAIILFTSVVSFPAFGNNNIQNDLLFWPYMIDRRGQYYRFLTGGLIHADIMHLIFNMVSLYSFGMALEEILFPAIFGANARALYISLYILAIVFAGIPDYIKHRRHPHYRALGASGAVSGVIYAAIMIVPNMPIRFFFFPIDIPGYLFGFAYLALSYYMAKRGGDNIGHSAHFWGAVFGLVFTALAAKFIAHKDLVGSFFYHILPG
jgi:membrane associated rhomboid family serine protease